jgi:hypothetical protein
LLAKTLFSSIFQWQIPLSRTRSHQVERKGAVKVFLQANHLSLKETTRALLCGCFRGGAREGIERFPRRPLSGGYKRHARPSLGSGKPARVLLGMNMEVWRRCEWILTPKMPKTSFLDIEIFQELSFTLSRGWSPSNVSV